MLKVKRALISVSDKTGLLEFARGLQTLGIEILSTGGTARNLKAGGIAVQEVSEYTDYPEILDGRVKTLHPKIHGGILALRNQSDHMKQLEEHNIGLIDLVVINLYPFERVTKKNISLEEALENIDIGGPAMIRSAAKNFKSVAVICNPRRYKEVLKELDVNVGLLSDSVLMNLAIEAFGHTAQYDRVIFDFLNNRIKESDFSNLPKELTLRFQKLFDLRYGENPHQRGAFYSDPKNLSGLAKAKQLHGKELSFNNFLDLNAAVTLVNEFSNPAAAIVKHNNPTGVAEDETLAKAYKQAWQCDSVSAFGGVIGLNKKVDLDTATLIARSGFMECIIAPGYDQKALKLFSKNKNLRIMQLKSQDLKPTALDFKPVEGGLLVQDRDHKCMEDKAWRTVTKINPTESQLKSLKFGWKIIKHIRSNAVILVKGTRTIGIGCGQTSRVESTRLAIKKAGSKAKNTVLISDAFIPKTDNVKLAVKAGVSAIIQTGGSIADPDVIKEANKARIPMIMTGARHFKH